MAPGPRRIVVGYDGSEGATRALTAAADLVGYGSTLAVVTVHAGEIDDSKGAGARELLQRRHVTARYHDARGDASERLVEKARELDADLLVIGRQHHEVTSSRVVGSASCDVLVVR